MHSATMKIYLIVHAYKFKTKYHEYHVDVFKEKTPLHMASAPSKHYFLGT